MDALPSKIHQDADTHSSTILNKSKSKLPSKNAIRGLVHELYVKYSDQVLPSFKPSHIEVGSNPSKKSGLAIDFQAGLSTGGFSRRNYVQNPPSVRRRTNSEISPTSKTSSLIAKRLASERARALRKHLQTHYGEP